jgi:glycine dehydrogenase subunit 1
VRKLTKFVQECTEEKLMDILNKTGVKSVDELFRDVPSKIVLGEELNLPAPLNDKDVESYAEKVLDKNKVPGEYLVFLGGGLPQHYVPAAVEAIVSRSEFYTAYTPYQPEISQGMLQALFEYQSMICDLTGMDVANSSMYDWATSAAEAIRMAIRIKGNKRVLLGGNIGSERKKVIRTYLEPLNTEILEVKYSPESGRIDLSDLENKAYGFSCLYLENPNFFGVLENEFSKAAELVHDNNGLFVVGVDPVSLAIVKPPKEYNADITVGEGQSLGGALNFGGPSLGILACKEDPPLVRQMPGRIIGITTDLANTQRGFTMVLQTREQHIRREQATSNICSNEALMAVGALSYMAILGSEGLRNLALEIYDRAHYASKRLAEVTDAVAPYFSGAFFQEFTTKFGGRELDVILKNLLKRRIIPGTRLGKDFPGLENILLSCFTEVHSVEDIDIFAEAVKGVTA